MTTKATSKRRRRSAGQGTIWKNANGTWTAQITAGPDRPSKTLKSERAARLWLTKTQRELDTGEYVAPSDMTLAQWWDRWVDVYKSKTVSKASLTSYEYSRKRLKKHTSLLDVKIQKVQPSDVQQALNQLSHLSARTRELTLVHLRDCFKRAQTDGILRNNAAMTVKPPRTAQKASVRDRYIDDAEYDRVLAAVTRPPRMTADGVPDKHDTDGTVYRDVILFCMQTGCRRGEACALQWDRIVGKEAIIDASLDGDGDLGDTKTRQARTVPLSPAIMTMLERRKFTKQCEYVFATSTGKPVSPRNVLRVMRTITNHNVHDLRHTYSTRAARRGVNPKVLQTITGQKTLSVVLGIYTHVTDQDRQDANAKINSVSKC